MQTACCRKRVDAVRRKLSIDDPTKVKDRAMVNVVVIRRMK